jgi:hypothetical protein
MNGVILSESAVMLHAIGFNLSPAAILQAPIGIILRQAAVRFERTGVSLRTIGILCRKIAVSDSVFLVSRKVTAVRKAESSIPNPDEQCRRAI